MAQLEKWNVEVEVTGQTRVRSREVSIFFKFLERGGFAGGFAGGFGTAATRGGFEGGFGDGLFRFLGYDCACFFPFSCRE